MADLAVDEAAPLAPAESPPNDDVEEQCCKICRLPSEADNPLYYPCKCSGSIRYVHESCLLEWIKHSKTNKCELCKHVYKFTDVYGPPREPTLRAAFTQLKSFLQSVPSRLFFFYRLLVVLLVWGCLFPILITEVWHFVLSSETYPLYIDKQGPSHATAWLPFDLNPVRLIAAAFKGIFIISGLFAASTLMFILAEHIEAYLEQVTFMRNHRRNRLRQANAPADGVNQDPPQADANPDVPLNAPQNPPQDDNPAAQEEQAPEGEDAAPPQILQNQEVAEPQELHEEIAPPVQDDAPIGENGANRAPVLDAPQARDLPAVEAQAQADIQDADEFVDEDEDEDAEALQKHWLLRFFGPRANRENNGQDDHNEENEGDLDLTTIIGLTGNLRWVPLGVVCLLLFEAVVVGLFVLIPKIVGKLLFVFSGSASSSGMKWLRDRLTDHPEYLESVSWISLIASYNPWEVMSGYLHPVVQMAESIWSVVIVHPLYGVLTMPTTIGYALCAVAILLFSAKRSPLAITTRFIILHVLSMIVMPTMLGAVIAAIGDGLITVDDAVERPPYYSRAFFTRRLSILQSSSNTSSTIQASVLAAVFPSGVHAGITESLQTIFGSISSHASYLFSGLFNMSSTNSTNFISSFLATNTTVINDTLPSMMPAMSNDTALALNQVFNTTSTAIDSFLAQNITTPFSALTADLEQMVVMLLSQYYTFVTSFLPQYLVFLTHLIFGYAFALAWVSILRNLRSAVKKDLMWFVKLPGDPGFSSFLWLANNRMRPLLFQWTCSCLTYLVALLLFVALPARTALWFSAHFFPFKVNAPVSVFQVSSDYNMAFTFFPICILLIKPRTSIPYYLKLVVQLVAKATGTESMLLPAPEERNNPQNAVDNLPQNAQVQPQEQGAPPEGALPQEVQAVEANQALIAQNDQNPLPAQVDMAVAPLVIQKPNFAVARMTSAILLGSFIFSATVFGLILFPWIVGSWVMRFWVPETTHLPLYTSGLGLYVLVVGVRTAIIFSKIVDEHRVRAARILNNDNEARHNLRRITFDNVFRSLVILLAMLLVIPVCLGYLIRIVFQQPLLPPNVMLPLHSSIHEYANGLLAMRILEILARLPIPGLAQLKAVLDLLSFDTILQVDYSAFLNYLVYPLCASIFILAGLPTLVNALLVMHYTDLADDVLANLKRKNFALIPFVFIGIVLFILSIMTLWSNLDQFFNGRAVIGRQIHNFNPDGEPAPQNPVAPPANAQIHVLPVPAGPIQEAMEEVAQENVVQERQQEPGEDQENAEVLLDRHAVLDDAAAPLLGEHLDIAV